MNSPGASTGSLRQPAKKAELRSLIVADYLAGYGAEVWQVNYTQTGSTNAAISGLPGVLRQSICNLSLRKGRKPRTLVGIPITRATVRRLLYSLLRQRSAGSEDQGIESENGRGRGPISGRRKHNKVQPDDAIQFIAFLNAIARPIRDKRWKSWLREFRGSCATGERNSGKTATTAAGPPDLPYAGEASIIAALIFKVTAITVQTATFFGELLQAGIFLGDGTRKVLFARPVCGNLGVYRCQNFRRKNRGVHSACLIDRHRGHRNSSQHFCTGGRRERRGRLTCSSP